MFLHQFILKIASPEHLDVDDFITTSPEGGKVLNMANEPAILEGATLPLNENPFNPVPYENGAFFTYISVT